MRTPVLLALAALLATTPAGAQIAGGSGESAAAAAERQGKLVTREELAATGADNVYDALRRLRRGWLAFDESRSRFASVYVDGEYAGEPTILREHPVSEALWVQYSDRREARVRFPSLREAAAIHLSTSIPLSGVHPPVPRGEGWENRTGISVSTFARRALGREDYFGDAGNAPGIGAGVEMTVRPNILLTVAASYGEMERSCPCPDSVPGRTLTAGVASAGVALKFRFGGEGVYAPYVVIGGEVLRASWDGVLIGGQRQYLVEPSDWGYGGVAGIGADLRLAGRLLLFAQADASISQFPDRWAGPTRSFRLGTTYLLGSER